MNWQSPGFEELHHYYRGSNQFIRHTRTDPTMTCKFYAGWKEGEHWRVYDIEQKKSDYFRLELRDGFKDTHPFQWVGETLSGIRFEEVV